VAAVDELLNELSDEIHFGIGAITITLQLLRIT
jgi:hypothetical protein